MSNAVIYLGPSLSLARARALLPEAEYRAPIRRGDIRQLLAEPNAPDIIGIIDGQFMHSLSISPKEVLLAIAAGKTVLGSSSMGALRAVELHTLGMEGVGTVFRWFRDGRLVSEDEVAVSYNPDTSQALCEPLVNMRYAFAQAVKAGVIDDQTRRTLIKLAQQIYFPERTYRLLFKRAQGCIAGQTLAALQGWLDQHKPDLKAKDAIHLLKRVQQLQQKIILPPVHGQLLHASH